MQDMLEIQGLQELQSVPELSTDGLETVYEQNGQADQTPLQPKRAGWETGSRLNIPASANSWTLIVLEDLLEAQAYYDNRIGAYYWRAVIGEIPVGQNECTTLEQAQDEAEQALWKLFEAQRDFWFETVRGEG